VLVKVIGIVVGLDAGSLLIAGIWGGTYLPGTKSQVRTIAAAVVGCELVGETGKLAGWQEEIASTHTAIARHKNLLELVMRSLCYVYCTGRFLCFQTNYGLIPSLKPFVTKPVLNNYRKSVFDCQTELIFP
jgi:hypothetical protein